MFKELKERFTKELVLAVPDLDKKMRMKVDVLDYATEEVLLELKMADFIFCFLFFIFILLLLLLLRLEINIMSQIMVTPHDPGVIQIT